MKNLKLNKIAIAIAIILSSSSCSDFLDREPLDAASENTFWKTDEDALVGLNAVYTALPDARDFWRDCQSDNSVMTNAWGEAGLGYISMGNHNPATGYLNEEWRYDHIRKCLYFLERLRGMEIDEKIKKRYEAEARVVLGMRYLRMVQLFGDIPLIKEGPISLDESNLPRTKRNEVLKYALDNADFAVNNLPDKYSGADAGRITKGAALMLKANILLYEASLKKFHEGIADETLWKAAYEAANQILSLGYKLVDNYSDIFKQENNRVTDETILAYQYVEDKITHMTPVLASPAGTGITGNGWASFCPTRDLIDSYLCTDGKPISESTIFKKDDPYANRDKRLKMTFMLPGEPVLRPNGQFSAYQPHPFFNQSEKINSEGGGLTGYMYLKFNEPSYTKPSEGFANWPIYRYSEALLIIAEALNEYNPGNVQIKTVLDLIRERAGLPSISNTQLSDRNIMRQLIREERRHEFVAEHKRYFDILRWRIAEEVLSKPAYGINSNEKDLIGDWTKPKFLAQNRVFDKSKHYLWPIPQSAIDRNHNLLPQNPRW